MDSWVQKKLLVAAIDFGTSYSGYAYAFLSDYEKNPQGFHIQLNEWTTNFTNERTAKTPTTVLFTPEKEFDSFGYEAEETFVNLIEKKEHRDWYYFKNFKMKLYDNLIVNRDFIIEDEFGKGMPAHTVFTACIKYMKSHLRKVLDQRNPGFPDESIFWVITVPAIWNESAKQFMREAANDAGIDGKQMVFALEAEAAALYCKALPEGKLSGTKDKSLLECFQPGGKYMVLDLGGGTVDTTVHGVKEDGGIVEIHKACGGPWGGTKVDSEFINYVLKMLGEDLMPNLKETCAWDWVRMEKELETRKRKVDLSSDKPVRIEIPAKILFNSNKELKDLTSFNKMKVDHDLLRTFFKPSIEHITKHIEDILKEVEDIQLILMVGGYSESDFVAQSLRKKIPNLKIIVPIKASVSVLEGAVRFGFNPQSVVARICRFTYGFQCHIPFDKAVHPKEYLRVVDEEDICINIFQVLAEEGETIRLDEKRVYNFSSSHKSDKRKKITLQLPVYASKTKRPKYTTDDGCVKLGIVEIHPPEEGWPNTVDFNVKVYFGRTEFSIKVKDATSRENYKVTYNFLEEGSKTILYERS
ncbi:hypothetical protein KUTeg_018243 [Tegillarca granosa]|uniref:Heat shock 70 kDa protein 12A n=1 Tax=Tegillarca granosa TaxID=220873 RepID=A0ABQ9EM78_TEGGR|nr:hypothetical protein KUTeg_018243 [Tegillarca granosa]